MAHRVGLTIALTLDGDAVSSDTRYTAVGAAIVVVQTTIPRPDVAVSLHSTYSGHPGIETTATHLWLARHRTPTATTEHHDDEHLGLWGPRTPLVLDHLLVLQTRLAEAGHSLRARTFALELPAVDA